MKQLFTILFIMTLGAGTLFAQVAVNQNGGIADSSAMLDVQSTSKGMLVPRMNSVQRTTIASPANGLLVFDTVTGSFWFYGDTVWVELKGGNNNSVITDLDGDTKVNVESSVDSDTISFETGGTKYFAMHAGILGVNNTGKSIFIGNNAGSNDDMSDNRNIFIGDSAGYNNSTGYHNTGVGYHALSLNTIAENNTAFGYEALASNSTNSAFSNTAVGYKTLSSNQKGFMSTAFGSGALQVYEGGGYNSFSNANTAIGGMSMRYQVHGGWNVAVGVCSLEYDTLGYENVAVGASALQNMKAGDTNTAVGTNALYTTYSGDFNTVVGAHAYPRGDTVFDNYIGIGYNVGSSVSDADNRVEIGNTSITWIGGQVTWSTYSDERIKDNIKQDVPGLDFIMKLEPVTYNLNIHRQNMMAQGSKAEKPSNWKSKYDIEQKRITGFLAQDVAEAAQSLNYEFSGVEIPENNKDLYSLSYSEFVVPLVKAIQEQQQEIETVKEVNHQLKNENKLLKQQLQNLEQRMRNLEAK